MRSVSHDSILLYPIDFEMPSLNLPFFSHIASNDFRKAGRYSFPTLEPAFKISLVHGIPTDGFD
jgi:hypothetical protein